METVKGNLVVGMRWFQTTYTVRFNRRHHVSGHLFQGRYKSVIVDPKEREHFEQVRPFVAAANEQSMDQLEAEAARIC